MIESHFRSIVKAASYRVIGSMVTFLVAWILTRKFELAAQIGLLDTILKIGAFYAHERLWNNISFGRKKKPEYNI
jgi:uncharacterized membrane protein